MDIDRVDVNYTERIRTLLAGRAIRIWPKVDQGGHVNRVSCVTDDGPDKTDSDLLSPQNSTY